MDNLLEINNLSYSYQDKLIFNDLQISIKKETLNLILGPNSCGKTTLIRLLSGILPSNNNISVNTILLNKKNLKAYLLSIGVVFFDDNNKFLFDKVIDELAFPLENLNHKKDNIINRIYEVRDLLELHNCINKNTCDLTTYEQVRVLIGVAIIHKPKVIFLDNILSNLNDQESKKIFRLLDKIKKDITICITSSDIKNILYFDNVIVINDGKAIMEDTPNNILSKDNELSKMGIAIPHMIDLSLKLSFYGLVDEVITDVDRMVDELWK